MKIKTRIKQFIRMLLYNMHERRKVILALSCLVVFVTTYTLILPAFTLDKEEAADQGGIDVPAAAEVQEEEKSEPAEAVKTEEEVKTPETQKTEAAPKKEKTETAKTAPDDPLKYEGTDYNVAVTDKNNELSASTRIEVNEISADNKKQAKQYKELYSDALKAVREEDGQFKVADFEFAKFYDISLVDGKDSVETKKGVDVTISYEEALQKELKVADPDKVRIIHFAEDKKTGEITPEVLGNKNYDVTVDKQQMEEASFEAEGFSVYAVVYTVDFAYDVDGSKYEYSIEGGSTVDLADVLTNLKVVTDDKDTDLDEVKAFIQDIEDVKFSDPELVEVVKDVKEDKVEGFTSDGTSDEEKTIEVTSWELKSLKAFDTNETLTITMKNGDELVIDVTDSQQAIRGATVHYGYEKNGYFYEFTPEQFTPPTSGFGNPAYLIYDVPGYQYAGTTYYSRRETDDMWNASEVDPQISGYTSGHYYVTYEPRPAATTGGDSSIAHVYPDEPTVTKSSTENPDTGTNTISLEVEGKRNNVKHKADIIVIYDISGSMKFPIGFNSETDIPIGGNGEDYFVGNDDPEQRNNIVNKAIKDLARGLIGGQTGNDPAVQMAIVPFSTDAKSVIPFTGDLNTFNTSVDGLRNRLTGGTNWEDALQTANAIEGRPDADTYIVFVTDGNPTFRITRGDMSDAALKGSGGKTGVTDYYYNDLGIFGTGNVDPDKTTTETIRQNNAAAKAVVDEIVGNNKTIYGIGISPEVTRLNSLIPDQDKVFQATTDDDVQRAIDAIQGNIKELTFGYSNVKIEDGITGLTQTVQKTGMTTLPPGDDYEYFKGHAATQADVAAGKASAVGETVWEPWTEAQMAAEGAGRASYNESTGAVEWNLGDKFMLEDGVKYKVDFTVWPSQEAYDILADINNSCIRDKATGNLTTYASPAEAYGHLPEDVRAQITESGGSYVLKTNEDDAGYSYQRATKEGDDGEVTPNGEPISGTFDPVIPLNLRTDKIGVKKSFNNLLDSRDPTQISLELWGDRLFKTFTLTKDGQWTSDNNYISCGLLTVDKDTGELYVYETGHDFTLKETGDDSIYWELTADTYHPMVINDELHMLSKVDAPEGMTEDKKYFSAGGKEYYRVEGTVYEDKGTNALLKAVNDHRSFLDLSKVVVDKDNNPVQSDDMFTYRAKFVESRVDDPIIFTVYDTVNKQYIEDQSITTAVLKPADDPNNKRQYYVVANKTEFTLSIKQGWNVRFLNLSNDTTYEIEEVLPADSEYEFVKIDGSAQKRGEDGESAAADTHMTITSGQTEMTGTIFEPNVLYSIKYTNRAPQKDIRIFKTGQNGTTPLAGAKFSFYGSDYLDDEGNVNPDARPLKTNQVSGADGIINLGKYTFGTYYLVEDEAPKGFTKFDEPVRIVLSKDPSYEQEGVSISISGNGLTPITDDEGNVTGYQFTVVNNEGVELPSAGGIGTTIFYVLGSILAIGCAIFLISRRRLRGLSNQ